MTAYETESTYYQLFALWHMLQVIYSSEEVGYIVTGVDQERQFGNNPKKSWKPFLHAKDAFKAVAVELFVWFSHIFLKYLLILNPQ